MYDKKVRKRNKDREEHWAITKRDHDENFRGIKAGA
jgi:hypothetical protein